METVRGYLPNVIPSSLPGGLVAALDPRVTGRVLFSALLAAGLGISIVAVVSGVPTWFSYALVVALTALVCLALNARGRTRAAVVLMLLSTTVCAFSACLLYQGMKDVAGSALPVIIMLAGITLERRLLVFFTALISAGAVGVSWVRWSILRVGTLPSSDLADLAMVVITCCLAALITGRLAAYARRSLQMLGESEERFRGLFENATLGIYRTTDGGRIEVANGALVEMLGYKSSSALAGRNLEECRIGPEGADSAFRQRLDREGVIRGLESAWARKDGVPLFVRESARAVKDERGRVRFYEGIVEDITERKRMEEALRASEERLALALDVANGGLFDWEVNTGRIYFSPEYFSRLGYGRDELPVSWEAFLDLLHPDDREKRAALIRSYRDGSSESHDLELRVRTKQGSWRWILSRDRVVERDAGMQPVRIIGALDDITERKAVEEELLRRNEFIQAVLENISDGVVACDGAGNLALFNKTAREWHGIDALNLPAEEWSSHYDLFGADGTTPLATERIPLRRAFCGEHLQDAGMTIAARGKPLRHLLASGRPFYDHDGQKLGAVAVMRDVTEHKRAEQALRESEERFRATFDQAAVGIAHAAPDGRYLRVNQRFCEIVGYSQEQALERTYQEITHPDDLATDVEQADRLLNGEAETYSMEKRYVRQDGSHVWVELTVSLVRNQAGEPDWFVSVIQDISARKKAEAALRQSENIYRAIGESINYGVWVCAPDGRNTYASQSFLNLVGLTQEQCSSFGWGDALHPDDAERTIAAWKECVRTEGRWDWEHRFRGTDGEWHHLLARGAPVRDEQGHITCWAGIDLDISALKGAQERLRTSEMRLLEAQRIAKVGSWEYDLEARRLHLSDEILRIFGLPAGASHDYPALLSRIHAKDRERIMEAGQNMRRSVAPCELEYRIVGPEGEVRFARTIFEGTRNNQGELVRIVGATQDVTEHVKARESLRESEERLKAAERMTHVGYWQLDIKSSLVTWSEEVCRIFGQPQDFIATYEQFLEAIVPSDRERVDRISRASVAEKKGHTVEFQIVRPNGETRTVTSSAEIVLDEEGAPARLLGACQDITDLKRAQEKSFEREKLESVGTLANGIAHDFNNLMGAVLAQAELAQEEMAAGVYPGEQVQGIKDVAVRGSEIVRELMIYAGKESDVVELVDVSRLTEEMLGLLGVSISMHARLEAELGKNLPAVWANAAQLRRIVMNLVTNASDAIGARDGAIRVTTKLVTVGRGAPGERPDGLSEGDYLQLEVSDTGSGMSAETQSRVFDPFFTTKAGGHGLGMAVVHGIVRSLGGAISLTSELGKGTTFQILLPCAAALPAPVYGPMSRSEEPANSRGAAILVVEDEDCLRQPTSRMLRKTGFSVIEASDGSAALEVLREHKGRIDVLLLDITLPGASSREVYEEARLGRPGMKVIVTTAYSEDFVARSLQAKIEHFLRKPYRFGELLDLLRRTLS